MYSLLNVGSLILGVVAWLLPVVSLVENKKRTNRSLMTYSIISLTACGISLFFQIFYTYYKVSVGDWSALLDTMHFTAAVSAILLIVTVILNLVTLWVYRTKITSGV
ncbi:hypothetical protein LCM10_04460 [Rossellomorea aquimaris]|uniref:hypothetical protein n=1 Tax=Rossellomorea aquimaris TaxID=189382 RepID=UPI001CD7A15D|nr:hypothetical protein [Rossellomorea aquimaris]MCA1054230.1 hypothetical protein [Rossellomorea aquimaris]